MASTQRSSMPRSWLTTTAAPGKRASQPSSHIVASRSRWLVGSSSSSSSGSRNRARASATRMRQPPEYSPTGRACAAASKPRPSRMAAARAGALSAWMAISRSWISAKRCGSGWPSASASSAARSVSAARTVSSRLMGPAGASCATWPMRARAARRISPPSGWMSPPFPAPPAVTIARSSVDLPAPLRPTRPTLRPGSTTRPAWSSSVRPAMRSVRSRMVRTVMAADAGSEGGAGVSAAAAGRGRSRA